MRYSVLMEPVSKADIEGYNYAHIPSLDLTTHGLGIEGALRAAEELAQAWVAEKQAHAELSKVPLSANSGSDCLTWVGTRNLASDV